MNNYQRTADWLAACGKTPSPENLSVQIGCHIEEFAEFLFALKFEDSVAASAVSAVYEDLHSIASAIKSRSVKASIRDRVAALDAICDSEVTGNGVAYLAGMNKPMADAAVLRSNDAKLVDGKPVILDGGKIGKPQGWKAPDLYPFAS